MSGPAAVEPVLDGPRLLVDLGSVHRCLSSAVLGGGAGRMRTWLNLQVPDDYGRTDPAAHLAEEATGLAPPVVGMMTAAPVAAYADVTVGVCRVFATTGVRGALAAAATRPRLVGAGDEALQPVDAGEEALRPMGTGDKALQPGTINLLVVLAVPLAAAGLVNALATAVEAKVQALAAARIPAGNADGFATGTATDSICVACVAARGRVGSPFAGPATRVGGDVGRAVYQSVLAGIALRRLAAPHEVTGTGRAAAPREVDLPGLAP